MSTGVGVAQGTRNSPTVWNAAYHGAQFWDGRAPSLEEQAKGPLINPVEMAMPNFDAVVARVKSIPGYVAQFDRVFGPNSVTIDNIAKAIATYERTLVSGRSKFDTFRFVDKGALTQDEWAGFQTFRQAGCMQCHMGPDFNGPPPLARGGSSVSAAGALPPRAGAGASRHDAVDRHDDVARTDLDRFGQSFEVAAARVGAAGLGHACTDHDFGK